MSLLFSPYLSQILTKLLETLISVQGIKISIYVCNALEVILVLFDTINFTTKDQSQPVWTSFFRVLDRLELVFKGPVAVPEDLNWFSLIVVASCLFLEKKTGLNWTRKHYLIEYYLELNLSSLQCCRPAHLLLNVFFHKAFLLLLCSFNYFLGAFHYPLQRCCNTKLMRWCLMALVSCLRQGPCF